MKSIYIGILLLMSWNLPGQNLHHRYADLPCVNKEFNIFVHAVYDSLRTTITENEMKAAIETANKYFEPICISFRFCEMDTVFNYNYNELDPEEELDELSTLYVAQNRINLYVISEKLIEPSYGGLCAGSVSSLFNPDIFLKGPGALTHELGHFFGLAHTFQGNGTELADGSNCQTAGDKICDTPADPYVPEEPKEKYLKNCVFIGEMLDANGHYYQPDVGNIMSYYSCDCGFTRGQYLKMAQNYMNAFKKHW